MYYIIANSTHYKDFEIAIKKAIIESQKLPIGWYKGLPVYKTSKQYERSI